MRSSLHGHLPVGYASGNGLEKRRAAGAPVVVVVQDECHLRRQVMQRWFQVSKVTRSVTGRNDEIPAHGFIIRHEPWPRAHFLLLFF